MKQTFFKGFAAALLMAVSFAASAQNGKFITDQPIDNNTTLAFARTVNPADVLYIDENPAAKTIVINYADGVRVENWVFTTPGDYNAVLDKFVTGTRANGNDFYYTSTYGSNGHRRVSYHNVSKTKCDKTLLGGQDFYTVTIYFKTGSNITSDGIANSWVCGNFN